MARKTDYKQDKKTGKTATSRPAPVTEKKDLLGILDSYFDSRLGWMIWVILGITFIFSLLLFDSRVSLSGDDSFYIIRASDFIHSFKYPAFQGPLYPMVLSLFVAVFGISLVPLKVFSLLLILGFMYLFFISFRSRIPSTLLIIILLSMSVNSFVLYYASQTYNEAFYLFVQMVLILVFFRYFIDTDQVVSGKQNIKRHMLLALSLLALALTKNIGYSAVLAVAGYFLLQGQWKNTLYSITAFALVMLVFQGIKFSLWHDGGLQFSTQGSGLMNKDYYNPQAGKEDLAGFLTRIVDNSKLYLSKHFVSMIGLKKVEQTMTVNSVVTLLIYIFSFVSLVLTYRRNKYLFFTGLLTGIFLLVSFLILQVKWDQNRLIIPAVPFLLLIIFSSFYYASLKQNYKILQLVIPALGLLVFFQSLAATAVSVKANQEISGRFGGLTPDWKNYLKASEWAATNLPDDAIIACRKPSISFVYGKGRNFYGIMQLPTYSTDVFFNNWSKQDSSCLAINYAEISGKQLSPKLNSMIRENILAMLFVGDTVFLTEKIGGSNSTAFRDEIRSAGISTITSAQSMKSIIKEGQVLKLYYPDSLLNQLRKDGVTHMMTASLRRNSTRKDGFTINTVERFMAFIQEKYPLIFTKVSQVGDDDNEPAVIYRIEYEKYGLTVTKK